MWRVILILAACLVVADTTGLLPEDESVECADEAAGRQCPPTCPTCTCAWHSLKTAPPPTHQLRPILLTARQVDLPPPAAARGRLAPPPSIRPPILPS